MNTEQNQLMDVERKTAIRIGPKSVVLAERRFYDDTYLFTEDGAWLFICDAAIVRGPSGREYLRTRRDVLTFEDTDALVDAIVQGGWEEAPLDENPHWKPTRERMEASDA